jgi:hypothetical protein
MDVIGHEAISIDPYAKFSLVLSETFEVSLIISVISKGLLPLVAAHNDVVEQPGRMYSRTTSHEGCNIRAVGRLSRIESLTPTGRRVLEDGSTFREQ